MATEKTSFDLFGDLANSTIGVETFEIEKICSRQVITQHAMVYGRAPELFVQHTMEGLMLELVQFVATQKLDVVEEKWPKDWLEAFKERWAPKWLLKKYPVQYKRMRVEAKAFYPKVPIDQRFGSPVVKLYSHKYSFER